MKPAARAEFRVAAASSTTTGGVEKTTGPDVSLAASQAKAELRAAQSAAAAAWLWLFGGVHLMLQLREWRRQGPAKMARAL